MYVNYRSQRFWRQKCSCWTNSCYLVNQITTSPGKIDVTILVKEHRHSGESGHKHLVGSSSFLVTLLWWEFILEWQVVNYYTYSIVKRYAADNNWKCSSVLSACCWWGHSYDTFISQCFHKDMEEVMPLHGFLRDPGGKSLCGGGIIAPSTLYGHFWHCSIWQPISDILIYVTMLIISFSGVEVETGGWGVSLFLKIKYIVLLYFNFSIRFKAYCVQHYFLLLNV